jgi:creatinine amidohydrolase
MRISELNWMDVEVYLKNEDRIIVVLGACEQHGYLSLQTDTKIPLALADAASERTNVIIAPEITIGVSPYFLSYPGTISIRGEIYIQFVGDFLDSLYQTGFRKILILNGHSGNNIVRTKLVELANSHPELKFSWYSWWESNGVQDLAQKYNLAPEHASWMESFPFTRVADLPVGEKPGVSFTGVLNAAETRAKYGDGSFGGKYQVDDSIMQELFDVCLLDIIHLLNFDR